MASGDEKQFYSEKQSPVSSEAEGVQAGHVGKLRSRLPHFSLEVRQEPSSFAKTAKASNADFDPIPPSKRTWNWFAYVAYWMADAWAVSNWEVGESAVICFRDMSKSKNARTSNDWWCSFFHDRGWPQLENGHRRLRPW